MQEEWWYASDGTRQGPVKFEFLRQRVLDGSLSGSDLVWTQGMSAWKPISDVPILNPSSPALPPELPPPPNPKPPIAPPAQTILAAPWRRFFARQLDLCIIGFPTQIIVSHGLAQVSPGFVLWIQQPHADTAFFFLLLPLMLVIETVIFDVFDTTPGKSLLGIQIRTTNARRLTATQYLKRQFYLYWAGLGTGFPLIAWFTAARQYYRLKSGLNASYDEELFTVTAQRIAPYRYVAVIVFFTVLILVSGFLAVLSKPNAPVIGNQPRAENNSHIPTEIHRSSSGQAPRIFSDADFIDVPTAINQPSPAELEEMRKADEMKKIENARKAAQQAHYDRILRVHPDVASITQSDRYNHWVSKSKRFIQITESGTTDEVIWMLNEYKKYAQWDDARLAEIRKKSDEINRIRNEAAAEALSRRYGGGSY